MLCDTADMMQSVTMHIHLLGGGAWDSMLLNVYNVH